MLLPTLVSFSLGPLLVAAKVCRPKHTHSANVSPGYSTLGATIPVYTTPGATTLPVYPTPQISDPNCFIVSGPSRKYGPLETTTSTFSLPTVTLTSITRSTLLTTTTPQFEVTRTFYTTVTTRSTDLAAMGPYTSTVTSTQTDFIARVTTSTVTITETSIDSTTTRVTATVSTSPGFTPINDSSGYTSLGQTRKRDILDALLARSPQQYRVDAVKKEPIYVKCVIKEQATLTVMTTNTITSTEVALATTNTLTTTMTSTTTETVVPNATIVRITTVTINTRTTQTFTSAATTSVSTTITETTASSTSFYAACATNNILGPQVASSAYVQSVRNSDPNGFEATVRAGSAYDCCVTCITGSAITNCQNTIFDAALGMCNPVGGNTCSPGSTAQGSYVLLSRTSVYNRYDSNGLCGVLSPDPS